jgi:hypothetical protein
MISVEDIIDVANSINIDISEDHIDYVMRNYESSCREDENWCETVECLLYQATHY